MGLSGFSPASPKGSSKNLFHFAWMCAICAFEAVLWLNLHFGPIMHVPVVMNCLQSFGPSSGRSCPSEMLQYSQIFDIAGRPACAMGLLCMSFSVVLYGWMIRFGLSDGCCFGFFRLSVDLPPSCSSSDESALRLCLPPVGAASASKSDGTSTCDIVAQHLH